MTTEQRVFGASEESVTLERSFFFQATTFVRKPPALGSAMSSTVTAMSFTVTHATDTPTEDDAATHVDRALNKMLLKGPDCAKCGQISACKQCACKLVYYCSKDCQREDWADHKARCTYKKLNASAHQIHAQEAFPGLPNHVVIQHILRSDTDPIVLARLKAVNRAMRDAVEKTGLRVEEMTTDVAAELGYLDTLKHKLQKGRLKVKRVQRKKKGFRVRARAVP